MHWLLDSRTIKWVAYGLTVSFLCIHIAMLVMFTLCNVPPMALINCFSVAFYVSMLYCVHKGWWRGFVIGTYLEVVIHMFCAVLFTGWNPGFQIVLIGMNALGFYAEYVGRTHKLRFVRALPLCLLGMSLYLISFAISRNMEAPYPLPEELTFWLNIAWGVIVFGVNIAFLQMLVLLTFHSEEWLKRQAEHDVLTGLPNRHYMMDYLRHRADRGDLGGCWAAMLDIDDFKAINDTYGHNCGDDALRSVGEILLSAGEGVECCRWGGEEFVMVGELSEGMTGAVDLLERLRASIESHSFWYERERLGFTVTIGVAAYEEGQGVSEWINAADSKLYRGKQSGKNQVVW